MSTNLPPKPKVLYAFQGTGNGHASRAIELIPIFEKYCDIDIICSGKNRQLDLPFKLKNQFEGISFYYNKKGGLSYGKTLLKMKLMRFHREVNSLDLSAYDLVLNDFEPVSAYAARRQNKPLIALSHQAAFLSSKSPRPLQRQFLPEWIFRHYAPARRAVGFHFDAYDNFIHFPIIRKAIRDLQPSNEGTFLVYLPAYSEEYLKRHLIKLSNKDWLIFSKECQKEYRHHNLHFKPIQGQEFIKDLANCEGLLCSAGFEAPAEALYLKKKLFVIPIKGQYEQECNAIALSRKGVPSASSLNQRTVQLLQNWAYGEGALIEQKTADPDRLVVNILDRANLLYREERLLTGTHF